MRRSLAAHRPLSLTLRARDFARVSFLGDRLAPALGGVYPGAVSGGVGGAEGCGPDRLRIRCAHRDVSERPRYQ